MKKTNKLIISSLVGVFILSTSAIVLASTNSSPSWMHKADEFIEKKINEKKEASLAKPETDTSEVEYDSYMKKAKTQEQKDAILTLKKDTSLGFGEWKRKALKIIGELPEDVKRLKIEDAKRIVKEKEAEDLNGIINAFNEIAGAPDWEGGSGIHRIIYFTDDNSKDGIYIINGTIQQVITDENGKQKGIPLREDITLHEPQPSSPPPSN